MRMVFFVIILLAFASIVYAEEQNSSSDSNETAAGAQINDSQDAATFTDSGLQGNISKILEAASKRIDEKRREMRREYFIKTGLKTLGAALGAFVIIYLGLNGAHDYRQARRRIRRRKLTAYIDKNIKLGKDMHTIKHDLHKHGNRLKHVEDAIYRYEKKEFSDEVLLNFFERKFYFTSIKLDLMKFKTKAQITKEFVSKGFSREKVDEAFFLLQQKNEMKHIRHERFRKIIPRSLRHLTRTMRRHKLFALIEEGLKRKKSFDEIYEILHLRGFASKHLNDAIFRFSGSGEKKNWLIDFLGSLESEDRKKKRTMHQIVKDGLKRGRSRKEVVDDLVNLGIRADDAEKLITTYKKY